MSALLIPGSPGELLDKITILEIKKAKITDKSKLVEIEKELSSLNSALKNNITDLSQISELKDSLKKINLRLWDIEDKKRNAEKENNFDKSFIQLARDVYRYNDERAKIKLKINNLLGSNIKEVKSYI